MTISIKTDRMDIPKALSQFVRKKVLTSQIQTIKVRIDAKKEPKRLLVKKDTSPTITTPIITKPKASANLALLPTTILAAKYMAIETISQTIIKEKRKVKVKVGESILTTFNLLDKP